ncbi:MAG: two-component regulator propeller domain-containing protein [Porticoccus sp.]
MKPILMKPIERSCLFIILISGLLAGCGQESTPKKVSVVPEHAVSGEQVPQLAASLRVLENFEVGEQVYVRSLAVEKSTESLWVGTSLGVHEVDLVSHDIRNTFTRDHGLANEYVFAIGIDPDGYKWFGTNAGGMSRYKDGDWKTFFPMHGLADYWIYSFANHPDGGLWVGTWAGANRMDRGEETFTTYVKELINEWVYGVDVDAEGNVWFGTEGGVSRFDGESWVSWNHGDGIGASNIENLPSSKNTGLGTRSRHDLGVLTAGQTTYNPNYVFSLIVAEDNTVWVGTWGAGVSHRVGDAWENYSTNDGLAGNIVYSILQDSQGTFWFGTNKGLSRYDGKTWQNLNVHDGLVNNDVYAVAEDPSGNIWIGTKGSVTLVSSK